MLEKASDTPDLDQSKIIYPYICEWWKILGRSDIFCTLVFPAKRLHTTLMVISSLAAEFVLVIQYFLRSSVRT